MKRYWLFAGLSYYADGGMADFIGCYDSIEECKKEYPFTDITHYNQFGHIVDMTIPFTIVEEFITCEGWKSINITLHDWKKNR